MAKTARRGGSSSKSASSRLGRGYIALAGITVAAMVIGVLAVVVEDFARSGGDKTIDLNDANDEVEAALRADMDAHPNDSQAIAGLANYLSNIGKIEDAIPLYERFIALLRERGVRVETGEFGAMMDVDLVNDGPVTLLLER